MRIAIAVTTFLLALGSMSADTPGFGPIPADAKDTPLVALEKKHYAVLQEELDLRLKFMEAGSWDKSDLSELFDNLTRLKTTALALADKADRAKVLKTALQGAVSVEGMLQKRFESGSLRKIEMLRATDYRMELEIELLKAKP